MPARLASAAVASLCSGLMAGGAVVGMALVAPQAALAQVAPVPYSALRALNLARNTAIQRNGGLAVYRPAQCMYESADAGNQCLISSTSEGYQFRFLGGAPGWQQGNLAATVETDIRISSDGRSVLGVDYNGAPR